MEKSASSHEPVYKGAVSAAASVALVEGAESRASALQDSGEGEEANTRDSSAPRPPDAVIAEMGAEAGAATGWDRGKARGAVNVWVGISGFVICFGGCPFVCTVAGDTEDALLCCFEDVRSGMGGDTLLALAVVLHPN